MSPRLYHRLMEFMETALLLFWIMSPMTVVILTPHPYQWLIGVPVSWLAFMGLIETLNRWLLEDLWQKD